jgi:glucan biosynthesis protein
MLFGPAYGVVAATIRSLSNVGSCRRMATYFLFALSWLQPVGLQAEGWVRRRFWCDFLAVLAVLLATGAAGQEPQPPAPHRAAPAAQPQTAATPEQRTAAAAAPQQRTAAAARPQRPAEPFTFETLQRLAQDRASQPYRDRSSKLPDVLAKLTYDQYRDIRFRRTSALWYDHAMFEVQFFHRGFQYDRRVNIYELVNNGQVRAVPYNPAMFEFGKLVPPVKLAAELGFAGFRVHYPLNTPAYKDEVLVFLGASYFRVLGRNEAYGLSARGLAINTATEAGEEFP